MGRHPTHATLPPAQVVAKKIFDALERYLHVEAGSGIALIAAATIALLWVNSPLGEHYHQFWDSPVSLHLGPLSITQSLHFLVNDGLMTVFFLVVGLEIRREMHEGALADWRVATLPLAAALGGVIVPATMYLTAIDEPALRGGWAVPTATDIAFAVGVLALLGRSIPIALRMFLLTFAIVDDIAAILIIAVVYSGGLYYAGLIFVAAGILVIVGFQAIGIGSAFAYLLPGALLWIGLLDAGLHPTLGGIGFTMSIFIASLALPDAQTLAAAKLGVLVASLTAGIAGFAVGRAYIQRSQATAVPDRSTSPLDPCDQTRT